MLTRKQSSLAFLPVTLVLFICSCCVQLWIAGTVLGWNLRDSQLQRWAVPAFKTSLYKHKKQKHPCKQREAIHIFTPEQTHALLHAVLYQQFFNRLYSIHCICRCSSHFCYCFSLCFVIRETLRSSLLVLQHTVKCMKRFQKLWQCLIYTELAL